LIAGIASGEIQEEPLNSGKDSSAMSLGQKGGLKGGKARAEKLTPEQRSSIARNAANKRWNKD
jgi:hypothetical protein